LQVLNGEKPANTPPIRSEAAPGARWQYSGGGFTIVQQALIDVAKEPFPKLLHDTVLAPIGMNHSTFEQPLPETLQGNAAVPYQRDGKPIEGGAYTYPELAAAGLWTTPSDLAVYVLEVEQSLLGNANHVLSVEMTRQMLIAGNGLWGLGLQIGGKDADPYFSHGGGNEGFRCLFVAYKQRGEGAVVMTNSDGGDQIADEVMHSIAMEYGWPDYQPVVRAAVKLDSAVLANYVGAFELGNGIDLVIAVENGQLISQVTGREKYPLYPESETRFFLTAYPADFEFFKDDQGKGSYLMLHQGGLDVKAPKKPATP
jgi:CubicO group peptidase (beta-lactamase class C family)